jgi:hypothetical protein
MMRVAATSLAFGISLEKILAWNGRNLGFQLLYDGGAAAR